MKMSKSGFAKLKISNIWIKYFTKDCNLSKAPKKKTSIDIFMESFQYIPCKTRIVKKSLAKNSDEKLEEEILSKLFGFDDYSILNIVFFLRSVIESPVEVSSAVYVGQINDFLARSFIIMSYKMKKLVENSKKGIDDPNFPISCWTIICNIFKSFVEQDMIPKEDIFELIGYFLSSFGSTEEIFKISENNVLRVSLQEIITFIVPYARKEFDYDSKYMFSFINNCFHSWIAVFEDLKDVTPFLQFAKSFLMRSPAVVAILEDKDKISIVNSIINDLPIIETTKQLDSDVQLKLFSDCVVYISEIICSCNLDCSAYNDSFSDAIMFISMFSSFGFKTIPEEITIDEENFCSEKFFRESAVEENISFDDVYTSLIGALQIYSTRQKNIDELFSCIIKKISNKEVIEKKLLYLTILLIVVSKNFNISIKTLTKWIAMITSKVLVVLDNKELRELNEAKLFKAAFLNFLFSLAKNSSKVRISLYEILPRFYPKETFSNIVYFLPLFRAFVLSDFFDFLESTTFSLVSQAVIENSKTNFKFDQKTIDMIVSFIGGAISTKTSGIILNTNSFLYLISSLFTIDRYKKFFPVIFSKIYSVLSDENNNHVDKMLYKIINMSTIIFTQIFVNESLIDVGIILSSIMHKTTQTIVIDPYDCLSKSTTCRTMCQCCSATHNSEMFKNTLLFIHSLCKNFPRFIELFNRSNIPVYSTLKSVTGVTVTREIVEVLKSILFNVNYDEKVKDKKYQNVKIKNSGILHVLLSLIKNTEFEEDTYKFFNKLCKKSIVYSYQLFMADIIGIIMERLSEKIVENALILFTIISSSFFSPLTLRDVIKTIAASGDPEKRNIILNGLLSLTTDYSTLPMTSFFHFNGNQSITSPRISNYDLNVPFIVVTTIRALSTDNVQPIFAIQTIQSDLMSLFIKDGFLTLTLTDEDQIMTIKLVKISEDNWYSISLLFEQNRFVFTINNHKIEREISFPRIDDDLFVFVGFFEIDFFLGDIGPFFILPAKNPKKAIQRATIALKTHSSPKKYIICYLPCNQSSDSISHVTPEDGKATSTAQAIPFTTSVCDVLNYDSTFNLVLPLFFLDKAMKYSIVLLQNIMHLDPKMSVYFNDIGGFHLLEGIFANVSNDSIEVMSLMDIVILYDQLDPKQKREMIESILINYPLWNSKTFLVQKELYGKFLPDLIKQKRNDFTDINTDMLLYLTLDDSVIEPYKFDFIENEKLLPSKLTDEEKREIKDLQWNIFNEITQISKMQSTTLPLFLASLYHSDESTQINALQSFEKIISDGDPSVFSLISIMNPFDLLANMLINSTKEKQILCLRCICSLGMVDDHKESRIQFCNAIEKLTCLTNKENADIDVFHAAIALAYGKNHYNEAFIKSNTSIFIPELLYFIFSVSQYFDDDEYTPKILQTVENHISALCPLFKMNRWLNVLLDYAKRTNLDTKFIVFIILEAMKTENAPFELIFHYFDKEKIHEIVMFLISFVVNSQENSVLAIKVSKLTCMYSSLEVDIELCQKTLYLIESVVLRNPNAFFVIYEKRISLLNSYACLSGIIIANYPAMAESIRNQFNNLLEKLKDRINQSMKKYAMEFIENPQTGLFAFKKYEDTYDCKVEFELKSQKVYEKSYNEFIDLYRKQKKNNELYSEKIFLLFMKKIRTDGGPWSISSNDIHWKYTPRTDSLGRAVFLTHNLNFDNHKKASAARDSMPIEEDADQEMKLRKIATLSAMFINKNTEQKNIKRFQATCRKLSGFYNGEIYIYDDRITFNGARVLDSLGSPLSDESKYRTKFIVIPYETLCFAFRRYYMHNDCGCEIFTSNWASTLLYFENTQERDEFFKCISVSYNKIPVKDADDLMKTFRKACNGNTQNCSAEDLLSYTRFDELWASRKISNYLYIFLLNIIGGRSLNDISQYPIYPWVISNYTSNTFNIDDPSFYRDFSKPIGAMNKKRLEQAKSLLEIVDEPTEQCLYRSNMSNPSSVVGFMIRSEPFTTIHIKLQDGKFDHANRLFHSVGAAWESVTTTNGDYRELIPQFFCTPYFLNNYNKFDLGKRKNAGIVDDVTLPPWAKNSFDFIRKNLAALESNYVSEHLNEWIDLTFGVYQNSFEHDSVFHCFSYHESVNLALDEEQLVTLQDHCANFGCMPTKILSSLQMKRSKPIPICISPSPFPKLNAGESVVMIHRNSVLTSKGRFFFDNKNHIEEYKINIVPNKDEKFFVISPYTLLIYNPQKPFITLFDVEDNSVIGKIIHQSSVITCVGIIGETYIITAGSDCVLYIWHVDSLELLGTLQAHSGSIQAICGVKSSDTCASVDEDGNVVIFSPSEKKVRNTFKIENCPSEAIHKLNVTNQEQIVVSSYSAIENKSIVCIYNTIGEELERLEFSFYISSINSALINESEEIILLTFPKKRCSLITTRSNGEEWLTKKQLKELSDNVNSNHISICSEMRKITYCTNSNEIRSILF